MKITNKILTAILICMPLVAWGADNTDLKKQLDDQIISMGNAQNKKELYNQADQAFEILKALHCKKVADNEPGFDKFNECIDIIEQYKKQITLDDDGGTNAAQEAAGVTQDDTQNTSATSADSLQKKVDDAQAKLDKAKETEQSFANRMLGGLTTAATGIGGMQLAQGLAEKSADSAADKDMDAYMATIKCTYGDGKSVPFSVEPVELPGGNNSELMKYRAEYIVLAQDLKERKTALDMKPGIEAEEIIDKADAGLYDDENTGITGGAYASRYRAAEGSEKDQKGLNADKKEAKNRMIAGGVIAGAGVVGGIVGNALINKDSSKDKTDKKTDDDKSSDGDNASGSEQCHEWRKTACGSAVVQQCGNLVEQGCFGCICGATNGQKTYTCAPKDMDVSCL